MDYTNKTYDLVNGYRYSTAAQCPAPGFMKQFSVNPIGTGLLHETRFRLFLIIISESHMLKPMIPEKITMPGIYPFLIGAIQKSADTFKTLKNNE